MRVFASVIVAFVGLGCTGQAPIGAASSEISQSPLCAWQADAPGSGLEIADESDEWQKHTPSFGYLVTTLARDNYQIFAFDQTMTSQIWSLTVMPDALPYYEGLRERIPFVFPATPPPVGAVEPDAQPVGGGTDGVGQVGSTETPLAGGGNGNGAQICLDAGQFATLTNDMCKPTVTPAEACGAARCGEVTDDCNVPHSCGSCGAKMICDDFRCVSPPKIFNPPCVGKCI